MNIDMILSICAAIVSVGSAITVLRGVTKPLFKFIERLEHLEARSLKDYERLNKMEETDKLILGSLFAILNNRISGNDVDLLKDQMKKLQNYLIGD